MNENVTYLLEKHGLENYEDYAAMLGNMSQAAKEMLESTEMGERDDIEKNNLKILTELLPICSDLFINCDPYYRK